MYEATRRGDAREGGRHVLYRLHVTALTSPPPGRRPRRGLRGGPVTFLIAVGSALIALSFLFLALALALALARGSPALRPVTG